jgi:NTP pyrophosphatase (non-canonical NTP hydrolase)
MAEWSPGIGVDVMSGETIESLADIWPMQAELNKRAGFDTGALGEALRAAEADGTLPDEGGLRTEIGRALKKGRQYELQDVQNARVEATDMLFFLISICQLLGVTPEDLFRLYGQKLGINHKRQDEDRSQAEHASHEDENRQVV